MKSSIRGVLLNPLHRPWQIHRIGFMKLDMGNDWRLHVWDQRYAARDSASASIHDHPWDFTSVVLAGRLRDVGYSSEPDGDDYHYRHVTCGPNGGLDGDIEPMIVKLREQMGLNLTESDRYTLKAGSIHRTLAADGTVTLIRRRFIPGSDTARVFWRKGTDYVNLGNDTPYMSDIEAICQRSLAMWW